MLLRTIVLLLFSSAEYLNKCYQSLNVWSVKIHYANYFESEVGSICRHKYLHFHLGTIENTIDMLGLLSSMPVSCDGIVSVEFLRVVEAKKWNEAKWIKNVGRIQARTIKARRRHGEQTCRPAGALLSVHTTMLPSSFSSRASAYCARLLILILTNIRSRTITKWRIFWIFFVKIEWKNGCLSVDQIIVVWFFESTQLCVSMKAYPHINWAKSWSTALKKMGKIM